MLLAVVMYPLQSGSVWSLSMTPVYEVHLRSGEAEIAMLDIAHTVSLSSPGHVSDSLFPITSIDPLPLCASGLGGGGRWLRLKGPP